jgi:hypothetical protein
MKKICIFIILAFLNINYTVAFGNYAPDEQTNIMVYEKISPAIVAIEAKVPDGVSAGTGCIVSSDGLNLWHKWGKIKTLL